MRNIGYLKNRCRYALFDFRHGAIEALDPLADRAHLFPQSRKRFLVLRGANRLGSPIALGLQRLALLKQCTALAVPMPQADQ